LHLASAIRTASLHHALSKVVPIDLVLIDQQSVGKKSLRLMDNVGAKKIWTSIYWRVNKFLKKCHIVTRLLKSEHHFCKFMTLMTFHFWERLSSLLFYSVSGNANSMVVPRCHLNCKLTSCGCHPNYELTLAERKLAPRGRHPNYALQLVCELRSMRLNPHG
jgi:hypothetical protein